MEGTALAVVVIRSHLVVGPLVGHLVANLGRSSRSRLVHPLVVAELVVDHIVAVRPLVVLAAAYQEESLALLELAVLLLATLEAVLQTMAELVDIQAIEDMLLAFLVAALVACLAAVGTDLAFQARRKD
jgi:hypothetical protein